MRSEESALRRRVAERDTAVLARARFRRLGDDLRNAADAAERAAGLLDDYHLRSVAVALRAAADRADALARP